MATRTTRVKAHTRTSKNGKVHTVKAHGRTINLKDMLRDFFAGKGGKTKAFGVAGTAGFGGLMWVLSTVMSVMAAAIWAIVLGCLAILTALLMTKGQRRAKSRKLRESAALSMERRMKLWTHHNVVRFKKTQKQETKETPKPQPAKKANDRPKTAKKVNNCRTCKGFGKIQEMYTTKEGHPKARVVPCSVCKGASLASV